jgi:circadian clock protein KaiB
MDRANGPVRPAKSLTLYVAGNSRRALAAMSEMRRFVEDHRDVGWHLEVVDVLQPAEAERSGDVLITPTLIVRDGATERRVCGRFDELGALLAPENGSRRA